MGLEITRKKDGTLRSKYWYGRFEVNGQSKTASLNVEIKGRVPATLRDTGDPRFERSRAQAQVKLDELIREARSHKAAENAPARPLRAESGRCPAQRAFRAL